MGESFAILKQGGIVPLIFYFENKCSSCNACCRSDFVFNSLSISTPNSIIVSAISGLIPVRMVEQPNNLIPLTILNKWLTTAVSTKGTPEISMINCWAFSSLTRTSVFSRIFLPDTYPHCPQLEEYKSFQQLE